MGKLYSFGCLLVIGMVSFGMPAAEAAEGTARGVREAPTVGRELVPEEFSAALKAHLEELVQDKGKRIEIRELRIHEKVWLPSGPFFFDMLLPEKASQGGNISATVTLIGEGREIKKFRISARIDIFANVLIAKHYLPRHQEIKPEDFQAASRNVAALPQDLLREGEEVAGLRTTISLNGQEVLRKSMVEVPPLVKKGDRVLLLFENAHFRITTLGELKEGGRRGDRVRLLNVTSNREVYGRVLDASTVQVEY